MNLRFLEAFVWVARLRSFKAAADKLHTTQAGISGRIATLEEQFGVRLFDRDRRAVTLTYHGTELLPHAERMLELQDRMRSAVGRDGVFSGMLRIGVIETVVHTWLPDLLSRFAQRYPNVTMELTSDVTPRLREALLHGAIDCAILTEEITQGFIDNRRIAELPMRWATGPSLAAKLPARRLTFAEIGAHPIISFHRDSAVYRNIVQGATAQRSSLRVNFFSSMAAMVDLARAGFGIAPLPMAVIADDVAQGRLVLLDVDPPLAALPLVASVRAEPASPLAEALAELAQVTCDDFLRGRGESAGLREHDGSAVLRKPHREFFAIERGAGFTAVPSSAGLIEEQVLADGFDEINRRGSRTRLVRWSAGALIDAPVIHDFCEDVFVIEGDFVVGCDAQGHGGDSFGPYTFACRPPQVWHGPFTSRGGCVMLETQYYD